MGFCLPILSLSQPSLSLSLSPGPMEHLLDPHLVIAKVHQTPPIELHKAPLEDVVSRKGRGQDQ